MGRNPGRTYVEKNFKRNGLILLVVLIITAIIIAVVTLIPAGVSQGGDLSRIGVSRSFVFPFAYLDEKESLKVIDQSHNILAVDDSVSSPVHDYTKEKIYYLREDVLYEYNIKLNKRRILVGGSVTDFRILNDRSAFVYVTQAGELHFYDYITERDSVIAEDMPDCSLELCLLVGKNGFAFMGEGSETTADVFYGDNSGHVKKLAADATVGTLCVSENEDYICFRKNETLFVTNKDGRELASLKKGNLLLNVASEETVAKAPVAGKLDEGVKIRYALTEDGKLYYFNGKKFTLVDSSVIGSVAVNNENGRIFYGKISGDDEKDMDVYVSNKGASPVKLTKASVGSQFIWLEIPGQLYCLDGNSLSCVDVYEDYNVRKVAEGVTKLMAYPGKSFVVYTDGLMNNYYVMPGGKIEQVANGSVRFYGLSASVYLLQSTYGMGSLSLDMVENDDMQRLDSDILKVVAMDSSLSQILYLNNNGLMLRTETETKLLDNPEIVTCVPLKE